MAFSRNLPVLPTMLIVAAFGVTACSDEPSTGSAMPRESALPIDVQVSTASARAGDKVAVAINLDVAPGVTDGIQGALEFDAARLEYVGQSPVGDAISLVNAKAASRGKLRFTSFNTQGVAGRVALFVFKAKGDNYVSSLRYVHQAAAGADSHKSLQADVHAAVVDGSLGVPADARSLDVSDWAARINPSATPGTAVALRPGEYRLNLKYGDVDFDNSVGLFDYLGVANAAVGNDQIIVGTDGPGNDVDLVIAGNVSPDNGGGACGREADGGRVLDLFDYLAIANEAVGGSEACVGDVIPGRGALPTARENVSGNITGAVTWTKDRIWQLNGIVRVQSGGVLTIQEGTRVEGNTSGSTPALFIERGGRINAVGTQNEPIVMTCTAADPKPKGCWGGVFVAGRARVNLGDPALGPSPDGCNQRGGEGGGPVYGGCDDTDNSGTLRYVRIEYAGFLLSANNELNGLTLGAVGSGTQVDHIQVHGGSDDGIEFFGGNVSTKYLVLTGNDDDQFDVSFGIRGDHQFIITQSDAGAPTGNDSKAIEADGNEPAPGSADTPRTSPRLWNFTIIGNLALRTQNSAIHLRRGSGLRLYNSLVAGYEIGVDIDDPLTCGSFGDGPVQILHTTFIEVPNLGQNDGSDPSCGGSTSTTEGEEEFVRSSSTNRERTGINSVLVAAYNTDLPDWRMLLVGGAPAESGTLNPSTIPGSTAVNTSYRGAVETAANGVIPWYAGWTRPFQTATTP